MGGVSLHREDRGVVVHHTSTNYGPPHPYIRPTHPALRTLTPKQRHKKSLHTGWVCTPRGALKRKSRAPDRAAVQFTNRVHTCDLPSNGHRGESAHNSGKRRPCGPLRLYLHTKTHSFAMLHDHANAPFTSPQPGGHNDHGPLQKQPFTYLRHSSSTVFIPRPCDNNYRASSPSRQERAVLWELVPTARGRLRPVGL